MQEWHSSERENGEERDLEKRLSAYYGPTLQEQPLAEASWQALRSRLQKQKKVKRHLHRPHLRNRLKRTIPTIPTFIQDAFIHIAYEARTPYDTSLLRCYFGLQYHEPAVHVSRFTGKKIICTLPVDAATSLSQAELAVLLATGLARQIVTRKSLSRYAPLLILGIILLASIALLLCWRYEAPTYALLIASVYGVIMSLVVIGLAIIQQRRQAFHADVMMVHWLGRSEVCRGLHALAERSRSPNRKKWGEPSLAERIERVCGTRVTTPNDRLTLVG